MEEGKILTKKELRDISLGYNWNPNMSFEEFVSGNGNILSSDVQGMYNLIESRYIEAKFN